MIDVALLSVIRRWHLREGVSIREIARRTKLSRNTIAKYVASDVVEPRYVRRKSPSQLDAYAAELVRWLERNARQGRKHRQTARQMHAALQAHGYPLQTHEMLFDAHNHAFAVFGGVPRRGIYDNMKTAVDRVRSGKARDVNARFAALVSHYLFEAEFCNPASGWEKGQIEKNVQDSRHRLWPSVPEVATLAALNLWLQERCLALWHELAHPDDPQRTIAAMWEIEKTELMPIARPFDGFVEHTKRVTPKGTTTPATTATRTWLPASCRWQSWSWQFLASPMDIQAISLALDSRSALQCAAECSA